MEAAVDHPPEPPRAVIHPLAVRISHWINAFAILIMILSGWRIHDADFSGCRMAVLPNRRKQSS